MPSGIYKRSAKHRRNLSKAAKKRIGSLNGFYGKHHTPESKAKMLNSHSPMMRQIIHNRRRAKLGITE